MSSVTVLFRSHFVCQFGMPWKCSCFTVSSRVTVQPSSVILFLLPFRILNFLQQAGCRKVSSPRSLMPCLSNTIFAWVCESAFSPYRGSALDTEKKAWIGILEFPSQRGAMDSRGGKLEIRIIGGKMLMKGRRKDEEEGIRLVWN